MPLSTGQVLNNRYRIARLLGQGGFGAVYRGWDINLERPRAVKENFDTSPEAQQQFKREAQMLADLTHPNLPKVFDHFFVPGQGQYLVMEFIEGDDLQAMLDRGTPLQTGQVIDWIGQVCDALIYLHSRQPPVIHRDIKPANIKITPQNQAVLVDFGIAKVYDPLMATNRGARAFTPGFSPPEQYGLEHTDAQSDVYALGATAYTLLTGCVPPESLELLSGSRPAPPPAHTLNPTVPLGVSQAIERAMQPNRAWRTRSIAEFKAALLQAPVFTSPQRVEIHSAPTVVTPTYSPAAVTPTPDRVKGAALGGGIALLILIIVLGWMSIHQSNTKKSEQETATASAGLAVQLTQTHSFKIASNATSLPTVTFTLLPNTPAFTIIPATSKPTPGIGATMISDKDGMVMVYVPAGEFWMGSMPDDPKIQADELPQHVVYLDAFWIDQTEVTNAMFAQFVQETGYKTDAEIKNMGYAYIAVGDKFDWQDVPGAQWRNPSGPSTNIDGKDNHPVVQVSWNDALAYCQWAGRALPTEAQWEKASRGNSRMYYPWGNQDPAGNLLNYCDTNCPIIEQRDTKADDGFADTAPVGSYPDGRSPYFVLDIAGNIYEWVNDWYDANYYSIAPYNNPKGPEIGEEKIARGGYWGNIWVNFRSANRYPRPLDYSGIDSGFRCATLP